MAGELSTLVQDWWTGDGNVRDASGAASPLPLMSIDRLDCAKGYHPDNVRLFFWPLNWLRRECLDDTRAVVPFLLSLKKSKKLVAEVPSGCTIPGDAVYSAWSAKHADTDVDEVDGLLEDDFDDIDPVGDEGQSQEE
ncbi:unnamed protein product [Parajaminaea phylloscopi]